MPNKKITVVGDGAEEPLTPEEEHSIEVRVDKMLDPALPDDSAAVAKAAEKPVEAAEPAPQPAVATPVAEPASVPKVTKIITKFADEPEPEATTEAAPTEPVAPAPAPSVVAAPKPAAKKITITHHDDESTEEPPQPAKKPAKAKPTAKKPAKKLKVTVADGSEPDDLAAKADAIAASALEAEEMIGAKQAPEEPVPAEASPTESDNTAAEAASEPPAAPEASSVDEPEELPETAADQTDGAPPLILKHGTSLIDEAEAEEDTVAEPTEPTADSPEKATEITVDESPEIAEEIPVDVEPATTPDPASIPEPDATEPEPSPEEGGTKKYRPPEGPIQFKRAEVPIQPYKPGEPRPEVPATNELSEDEALALAFETPKSATKPKKAQHSPRSLRKLLKWVILLALIAAVIAVAALPTLRHKALNLVGLDKTTTKTTQTVTSATTAPAATTPLSQDVYVSKRQAVYNIYKADITGQNEQLVLAGTGAEQSGLVVAPNAASTYAALVSTRDAKRNAAGALEQSMTLVDVTDANKPLALDTADQIKLIDWFGSRVVYVLLNTSTSTSDPNRYQIISYDTTSKTRTVLDHMNYLNDVLGAQGNVFYATSTSSSAPGQFTSIKPDGTGKQVILSAEVAAITRTGYDTLVLSSVSKWYFYHIGAASATATNDVGSQKSRLYIDSPDGKHTAYLNATTGATQLTFLDVATGKEKSVAVSGASYPLHWLSNDTLVYRSSSADYSIRTTGGTATKIVDVTDVSGVSLWHEQ